MAIAPITMIMVNSALYFLGGKQIGLIYTRRLLMDRKSTNMRACAGLVIDD